MSKKGIETGIHYNPIHNTTLYNKKTKLSVTEKVGKEIVSIPIHANLNDSNIDYVISNINKLV